ncbi:S26 family signal peptidase [Nocardioides coralli]|uniref:S26 family signal peptidase n=1 Tax=Nocardioides coralli TaxID=2872154 RepID=UPI001CA415EF|nr:S26 family signal peptidase [Nocardioides coralli]QZY28436.1 S26 family signal peptidase [Nocardioides coralli]
MEITATPRRGRRRRLLARILLAVAVLALVALLAPVALGLQAHTVPDDAMGDTVPRGAIVYGEVVSPEELSSGDVVIVQVPDDASTWVTRRIVAVRDDGLITRGDAAAGVDPWLVPLDSEPALVSFYVPWLGVPLLAGPLVWAVVAVMVAAAVTVLRRLRRTPRGGPGGGMTQSGPSPRDPARLR